MDYRTYKQTEEMISLLGFGCMRLPRVNQETQEIDIEAARAMIARAFEAGINYFDTAYGYHDGQSQSVMGEILSHYPRESFKLANKMPHWLVKTEEDVHRLFDEQLEKCQVEFFDYYLIHNILADTISLIDRCRIYEILKQKQQEGKIRRLGFSFHATPAVLEQVVERYAFDFAQIQLNYVDWELQDAKRQYEILTEHELPVIVMEPVRGGALANLSDAAKQIFVDADPKASLASWALRYAGSLPGVLTVLSGMSNMDQLEDNIATFSGFKPLTDSERETVAAALAAYRLAATIPCTACSYCMPCPFGVDIPRVFGTYNEYRKSGVAFTFVNEYQVLGEERHAHHCTACEACMAQCPQSIAIPKELASIAQLHEKLTASV